MKNIVILGFSESTRNLAPFDDESFDIWGCNHLYPYIPRWDIWYELHSESYLMSMPFWKEYEPWLRTNAARCYMQPALAQKWDGRPYPIDAVMQRFGRYFTSTIALMMAQAILHIEEALRREEPIPEVHLYGVDMTHDTEWGWQRACAEFYVGLMIGMGVHVEIPGPSALLKNPYLYGFEEPSDVYTTMEDGLKRIAAEKKQQHESAVIQAATLDGYRQAIHEVQRRVREMKRGAQL